MRRRTLIQLAELSVFGVVCFVFVNSIIDLVSFGKNSSSEPNRTPQSISAPVRSTVLERFETFEIDCERGQQVLETIAAKVRIAGQYCAERKPAQTARKTQPAMALLKDATALNQSNQYIATVFKDSVEKSFSTDFIPLVSGQNNLILEFVYQNGKRYPLGLTLIRK